MPLRHAFATVLFAATFATAFATTPPAWAQHCVTVEVHNVRPQQGHIMVAAYTDAEAFGRQALLSMRVPAGEAVTPLQLCGVTGALVALTLYQDLDGDGKMGRNLLGMPSEPWGSSGQPGSFGPKWETAKVALDGSVIVVRLAQ